MRCLIAIFSALVLTGCSDEVTTRFATLEDAKSQRAFERGWLPPVLPESARNIVESNNLDLNTGTGSFDYDIHHRRGYLETLARAGASAQVKHDLDLLTLDTNGSRWEISLPRSSGTAKWSIRQL